MHQPLTDKEGEGFSVVGTISSSVFTWFGGVIFGVPVILLIHSVFFAYDGPFPTAADEEIARQMCEAETVQSSEDCMQSFLPTKD